MRLRSTFRLISTKKTSKDRNVSHRENERNNFICIVAHWANGLPSLLMKPVPGQVVADITAMITKTAVVSCNPSILGALGSGRGTGMNKETYSI